MKHLLILLCVSTLVSCGLKNKLLNSTSGTLGVSKQLASNPTPVNANPSVSQQPPQISSVDKTTPTTPTTPIKTQTNTTDESVINWYYVLPFVGLAILGLLVYRLKQQNLKSL